jgi:putative transposase
MEPDMRYRDSIFVSLLNPIRRRRFRAIVESHNGNAYDKSFGSRDHLIALLYAQLSSASSLRGLETGWNANAHHQNLASIARRDLVSATVRPS